MLCCLVVCAVCCKDSILCDMCKGVVMGEVCHVEREFCRFYILHRTFLCHLCSERCMRRFDEWLSSEAVSGRLRIKQSFS